MKNPLNKRLPRELKSDLGKYLALFLFMTLMIGFVSGFLVAGDSMKTAYDESFEKYNIEDGHFTLAVPLPEEIELPEATEVYNLFYKDFDLKNDRTVRIYKIRHTVDRICLMDGELPQKNGEIALDRLYAENNGIKIGDSITVKEKTFRVCAMVALSDYSALFKNNTDMMLDANKFSVAVVTDDDFDALDETALKYNYAWRCTTDRKDQTAQDLRTVLAATGALTDFVEQRDNQAIIFTGDDIGGDTVMVVTLLYIVMAVLAFMFGISTRSTIEKEAGTIGTLRASGYRRGELVRHYMVLPLIVTVCSAAIGNALGYSFFKQIVVKMYYHSYSLPTYETLWNTKAFIMTTLIPTLIVLAVVLAVLSVTLKISPLRFLRHELGKTRKRRVMRLKHFSFITRFRLRVIFQNIPAYLTLFFGVVLASVLLLFGMMLSPMLKNFKKEVIGSKLADYQYILKAMTDCTDSDAEKYAVRSLKNDHDEEITVYGISENSKYFSADIAKDKVLLSDGLVDKYDLDTQDNLTLSEKYKDKEYTFSVGGSYHYPATMAVFMPIEEFREYFDLPDNYFNGYFCNRELSLDDRFVASVITQSDLTVMADQLEDSMGQMFLLMCGFSVILYLLLIYLLSKQITEKNMCSMSLIKILGYNSREISSLYNVSTGIMMMVSLLLSLPISYYLIKIIYRLMMIDFNGWLTFYVAPWIWPVMVALGAACYAVIHAFGLRRIRRIPMGEALKNIE